MTSAACAHGDGLNNASCTASKPSGRTPCRHRLESDWHWSRPFADSVGERDSDYGREAVGGSSTIELIRFNF